MRGLKSFAEVVKTPQGFKTLEGLKNKLSKSIF